MKTENSIYIKNVLITGGPTNEYIDEVMKITNMSSGKIAIEMAKHFLDNGDSVTLLLTKNIKCDIEDPNFTLIRFETTEQLLKCIDEQSVNDFDIIIHSAAVGDYKPEFSFRLEDMAKEIANKIVDTTVYRSGDHSLETREIIQNKIFEILKNPDCKVNDDTKISSTEPNLTVKLGLTPKIIAGLREKFPTSFICGFKLLENVSQEELIDAAMKQINKCNTDLVFANDLAELRKGNMERLVVSKSGYTNINVNGAEGIFSLLDNIYFQKD